MTDATGAPPPRAPSPTGPAPTDPIDGEGVYRRLLGHVRPYWRTFLLSLAGLVVSALTEPAIPALLRPLMDGELFRTAGLGMWLAPIGLVLLFLVRGAGTYVASVAMAWVSGKLILDLRRLMFERLLDLPTGFFDQHPSGGLISRATYNVTQVTGAATRVFTVLVRDSIAVLGLLAWMLYLNWRLALVALLVAPAVIYVVRVINRRIRHLARSMQQRYGDLTQLLEEVVNGQRVIRVFAGQDYERGRFEKIANSIRRLAFKSTVAGAAGAPVSQLVTVLGLGIIVYIASWQVVQGEQTMGGFLSFLAAMGLLFAPIKRLTSINERLQMGLAAAESIFSFIDQVPEPDQGRRLAERAHGDLRFEGVSFRYAGAERPALRNVDLDIAAGQTIALVGASGSGKTTLASLVPRFYANYEGRILLDGRDIAELRLRDLRANIALVSQDVTLFNDTVAANIAYAAGADTDRDRVVEAARAAHVLEFVDALPRGLDTPIGDNGVLLSGGQRQRLAIARAIYKDAPLLLLDEATSALDSASERHVQAALENLRAHRTTLIIAHRLSSIETADRIVVLDQGRIAEVGSHAELLSLGGLYTTLYRIQFGAKPSLSSPPGAASPS